MSGSQPRRSGSRDVEKIGEADGPGPGMLCLWKPGRLTVGFSVSFSGGERRIRMAASTFSEARKMFVPEQGEAKTPVAEIGRKTGIGEATYFD